MPRKTYDKFCEGCGKPYKGNKDQRFCGRPCQSRYAASHPKVSKKYSENAQRRWDNPVTRAAWLAASITPEANRKRSETQIGKEVSNKTRELLRQIHTGSTHTQETKDRISKACKKAWENPKLRQSQSRKRKKYCQTDEGKEQLRKNGITSCLAQFHANGPNKLEQASYDALDNLNIRYIPQHPMFDHFLVDAYLPDLNIVIEANGTYWHADPEVYGADDLQQMNKEQQLSRAHDGAKTKCLKKHGVRLIVLWERDKEQFLEILKNELDLNISG